MSSGFDKKRILIVHPEGNINNNPNLTGIVEILCENGCEVDIYSPRRDHIYQHFPCNGSRLVLIDGEGLSVEGMFVLSGQSFSTEQQISDYLREKFGCYDLAIGVDRGIIDAALIAQANDIEYGLISYEIFFEQETESEFKRPVIKACKWLDFAVCQDPVRARYLAVENGISLEKIINIPVAGRQTREASKSYYLHDKLSIPRDKRIVLFMGSIDKWSGVDLITQSVINWPDPWVLVLHNRYGLDDHTRGYFEKYKDSNKIFFSTDPVVDPNQLGTLLHCADAGIAFYMPDYQSIYTGMNIEHVGMASGKIATYMQYGVPVIINEIGRMSDCVRKYDLGQVVGDTNNFDITLAPEQLPIIRSNCLEFFGRELDLNMTIKPLLKVLKNLPPKARPLKSEKCRDVPAEQFRVSAIVSTYNSERFMRGCLEDLVGQSLCKKGQLEIIVVNSGSQQNEEAIVREFQRNFGNIKYIKTDCRETLYRAWNRAIKAATGRYITNANTDDRHREDALEVMAAALDAREDIGLVYADILVTRATNETFPSNTADNYARQPDFSLRQSLMYCMFGPQPMWRRSVHEQIGFFNPDYIVAADYDFFIKVAWRFGAFHISEILGLYLAGVGVESKNQKLCAEETMRILQHYRTAVALEDIYPALRKFSGQPDAKVAALLDFANCLMLSPFPNHQLAEQHYRRLAELTDNQPQVLNNLALCLALQGEIRQGIQLLQPLAEHGYQAAQQNLVGLKTDSGNRGLSLARIEHSVVDELPQLIARESVSISLSDRGKEKRTSLNPLTSAGRSDVKKLKDRGTTDVPKRPLSKTETSNTIQLHEKLQPNFKIGMAVLGHERPEYLEICLDTLFQTKLYNYDITFLLQDDGSNDPRVRGIIERPRDSKYKIIRYFTPKGPNCAGAAINKAVRRLMEIDDFDIIGWCDSDALFHPEWLDKTMKVCLWAKENHKGHILGPFSSFNSSDYKFHRILQTAKSPFGNYVVKRQMGMLNYFYFKDDFLKLGFFEENKNDETLMTEKFEALGVRNFCTETSYVEHIGQFSVLGQWRPRFNIFGAFAMNLPRQGWPLVLGRIGTLGYFKDVHHNLSTEPGVSSDIQIDVLIPYEQCNIDNLHLVVDSVRENLKHPINEIFLVGPRSEKIDSICSSKSCRFVSEDSIFEFNKTKITHIVNGQDRSAWLFGQLVKLAGDSICTKDNFLVLNGDTVLTRPQVFEVDGKTLLLHTEDHHHGYFGLYKELFGIDASTPLPFSSPHMLFNKELLKEFKERIETRHGTDWIQAIFKGLQKLERPGMCACELYGQWLFGNYPDQVVREYCFNMSIPPDAYTGDMKNKLDRCCRSVSFIRPEKPLIQLPSHKSISAPVVHTKKSFVIEVKYGGIGDHLLYSHLPRIAKQTGKFDKVYISNHCQYRNELYKQLVWQANPFVDGFCDEHGYYPIFDSVEPGTNLLDKIMLLQGLDDGKRFHEPELYVEVRPRADLADAIIYDPNYISNAGRISSQDVERYLRQNNINLTHQMSLRDNSIPINCDNFIHTPTLEEFFSVISGCRQMICLTTGTATIAAALGKPVVVLYGPGVKEFVHHSRLHKYVNCAVRRPLTITPHVFEHLGPSRSGETVRI
jgi:glycosyltransferase involved in cell wall biosynthesis